MKLSIYRKKYFEKDSMPAINTLKKWVDSGKIAGKKIGSMYFVDTEKDGQIVPVNDLVLKALQDNL